MTGSRIRELIDKNKNIEKKFVLLWKFVFFCFTMKWGLQRVTSVRKSPKLGMKKKIREEYEKWSKTERQVIGKALAFWQPLRTAAV